MPYSAIDARQMEIQGVDQMTRRNIDSIEEIIIHCSAYRPEWGENRPKEQVIRSIEADQQKAIGVVGFAYHLFIFRDGKAVRGRPLDTVGAHCRGHNLRSVGICLHGGFGSNSTDRFSDHFTPEQGRTLRQAIRDYEEMLGRKLIVSGHNRYAQKACPGFQAREWYKKKEHRVAPRQTIGQSNTVRANSLNVAAIGGAAGTVLPVFGGLPQITQIALIGLFGLSAVATIWIFRERLASWRRGVK